MKSQATVISCLEMHETPVDSPNLLDWGIGPLSTQGRPTVLVLVRDCPAQLEAWCVSKSKAVCYFYAEGKRVERGSP